MTSTLEQAFLLLLLIAVGIVAGAVLLTVALAFGVWGAVRWLMTPFTWDHE